MSDKKSQSEVFDRDISVLLSVEIMLDNPEIVSFSEIPEDLQDELSEVVKKTRDIFLRIRQFSKKNGSRAKQYK